MYPSIALTLLLAPAPSPDPTPAAPRVEPPAKLALTPRSLPDFVLESPTLERPPTRRLYLPIWASTAGTALGLAILGTGVALLAFDGRCNKLEFPDPVECEARPYQTVLPALPAILIGGGASFGFGIILGMDLARTRANGQQVMATWKLEF